MFSKKRKILIWSLFAAIMLFIGGGFFYLEVLASDCSNEMFTYNISNSTSGSDKNEVYADMSISKRWVKYNDGFGAQYDGVVYNNSYNDINMWDLEIKVPENSRIDSSWNGVYDLNASSVKVKPVDYNAVIKRNSFQTFGYVMYTPIDFDVETITVHYYKVYSIENFPLYWILIGALILAVISAIVYSIIALREHSFINKQKEYKNIIFQSLNTFANIIDAKDPYTKGHSTRVALYAKEIARRMKMNTDEQETIGYIALLHDVGKVAISDELLFKSGALTSAEMQKIRLHTSAGAEILKDFTAIPGIQDGANFHHEKYDGSGYPSGLKAKEIPVNARIICIADSFDAMSSDRCYRKRLSDNHIIAELIRCTGTQFDPNIVKYMIDMIHDGFVQDVIENEREREMLNSAYEDAI